MSDSITASQVLNALNLQGTNTTAATSILSGSQLTGIDLAALGVLLKNEVGSNVAQAYTVHQPISGTAQGNSGWTIGVTQLDFNTNPTGPTGAQTLLENALFASGAYSQSQATQIAQAFTAAGTSSTVNLPTGVTKSAINSALSTAPAITVINQNADASVLALIGNVDTAVSQLTNSATQAALTPGSSTFNASAYLALVDYANQFGGIDTPSTNNVHPMFDFLNGEVTDFPGGVQNFNAATLLLPGDLAYGIQAAELATKYADPSGVINAAAFNNLVNRQATQDAVGAAVDEVNGISDNSGSITLQYGGGQSIQLNYGAFGTYLATYGQAGASQPNQGDGWYQVGSDGSTETGSVTLGSGDSVTSDVTGYSSSGTETFQTVGTVGLGQLSINLDTAGSGTFSQTVGLDAVSGTPDNSRLSDLVVNLGSLVLGQLPGTEDPPGSVPNSQILVTGDASITVPDVNDNGLLDTSIGDIVSAEYRPGNQMLEPDQSDLDVLLPDASGAAQIANGQTLDPDLIIANLNPDSNSFTNIDPLVLDLAGNGISLSNWISNDVYFQSNVVFDPTTGQAESDGALHHTSWVNAGNGILVLPVNGQVTNITETLSEYFEGGQYNAATGQYTPWTDGLAALASLATPGATVFSAATSLTDPATGQSYWSELRVWQDTNQDGVAQPGELESLDTLGITAIGLVGSGNQGEQIDGNAITNTTTYTTSAGTTDEVAAVDLQTDTTGDLSTTASGGVIVTSTPEGGPGPTNTFVAQNATGHTYMVNDGTLTDQTTRTVVNSGTIPITGIFSTTQNDSITVNATDTGTYWLDGGSGADTLTGGAGTTVFLINPQTVVHGGSGFNIAYVNSAQPANIDLKTDNLQEVIGGSGGGVFNASGANWNVFIQATSGSNIIIGGTAVDALSGGSGDDIIEGGPGGSVIHAGTGNDVIYGGSGTNAQDQPNSDIIYAGPGQDTVVLGTNNAEVYDGSGSLTVTGNANGFSVVGFHGSYADYTLTHNADGSITVTNIDDEDGDGTVTMTNVTALDFNNIEQVKIANAAGMPVNDQLSISNPAQVTTSGNSYVIAAATLLANDIDYSGKTLSIRALIDNNGDPIARGGSGVVSGGVASLSADGTTITFTPTPGFSGVYSFRYYVVDSSGNDGLTVSQIGTTNTAEMSATVYLNPPSAPSDPLYDSEWFLQAANVPAVWQSYTGAGVSVGIFDPSGNVDFSNPDLAANAGAEVMIDGQPGQQQVGTHATLIAGIIGAADDGAGAVGVAPGATLDSEAIGSPTNTTGEATGIDDANLMDWSKYDVVNNSFQVTPPFSAQYLSGSSGPTDLTALQNAVQNGRGGLGTIVIFGGGNSRASGQTTNDFTETNSPYEITVGGIDAPSDLGALQISGAPFSDPGATILVSAPANQVTSTGVVYTNQFGQQFGADYQTAEGTSFATPIVAGVVALMLQANPNLTYEDVQTILAYSADMVDPSDASPFATNAPAGSGWTYNGATNWNGGGLHYSQDYGFGEVDALAAVRLAETWQTGSGAGTTILELAGSKNNQSLAGGSFTDQTSNSIPFATPPAIEYVQVSVDLQNVVLNDLVITITSPTGVVSTLMYHPGGTSGNAASDPTDYGLTSSFDYTFGTVADRGEAFSADAWTISISDDNASGEASQASLVSWGVTVTAGADTPGQTYVYTDSFGDLSSDPSNAARGTLAGTGYDDTLNAAAVTTGSIIDLTPGSTDSFIAGRSLTIGSDAKITTAYGGVGDDTLIAPPSTDVTLQGDGGDDTYQFGQGFGQDTVVNGWSTNTGPSGQVILGPGQDPDNLWLSQSGNDLLIQVLGATSQITVKDWYANACSQLQDLTLADGYQLTTSEIAALASAGTAYEQAHPSFNPQTATSLPAGFSWSWPAVIPGTSGNTDLTGTSGDDVFAPGPGNDTFTGNGGNDVYQFGAGDGQVTVINGVSSSSGPSGELALLGLLWNQVWFSQVGNNLVIRRIGSTDQVTVDGWFVNAYSQVSEIVFGDGSHLSATAVSGLVAADQTYATLFSTFSPATATSVPWSQQFFQTIASGSSIGGLASDYYSSAQGQPDLYVIGPTGELTTWIVSNLNIGSQNIGFSNASGAISIIGPASAIVGAGEDYFGDDERDIFVRDAATGQLQILAATTSGLVSQAMNFTYTDPTTGQPAAVNINAQTTVVGGGEDFWGIDGQTVFARQNSQLVAWEFNSSGNLIRSAGFTYTDPTTGQPAAVNINAQTTVVGGGEDFWGIDGQTVFARQNSQLVAWEFNSSGNLVGAAGFTYTDPTTGQQVAVDIDTQTTVVGGGEDFWGVGGRTVFARQDGQLVAWEFNSSGNLIAAAGFTYTDPTTSQRVAVGIDTGTTVVGGGEDFWGIGGRTVFGRQDGQLVAWEFDGSGNMVASIGFTAGGVAAGIDTATTVIGVGQNWESVGDRDIFFRWSNGDLVMIGFNGSGAEYEGFTLTDNGSPIVLDTAAKVVATGTDANGNPQVVIQVGSGTSQTYTYSRQGLQAEANIDMVSSGSGIVSGTLSITTNSVVTTTTQADGSSVVVGTAGSDVLGGTISTTTLIGNGGDDTYLFGANCTSEIIVNGISSDPTASGNLQFSAGITDRDLWFDRIDGNGAVSASGDNLRIDVLGTSRSVTIDNWFTQGDTYAQLSQIVLKDGMTLNDLGLTSLMQAMTTFEQNYTSSHGGIAFDPTSAANPKITDPGVLAAMRSAWQS